MVGLMNNELGGMWKELQPKRGIILTNGWTDGMSKITKTSSRIEHHIFHSSMVRWTASVVEWSEFLAANPEVLGSIPGAARFSE
jgi:hypothetical protein